MTNNFGTPRRSRGMRVDHSERNVFAAFGCVWFLFLALGIAFWGAIIYLAFRLVNHFAG